MKKIKGIDGDISRQEGKYEEVASIRLASIHVPSQ